MAPGAAHRVTARPHLACCQGNVNTLKRPAKLSISVVNDILLAITLVRPRGLPIRAKRVSFERAAWADRHELGPSVA